MSPPGAARREPCASPHPRRRRVRAHDPAACHRLHLRASTPHRLRLPYRASPGALHAPLGALLAALALACGPDDEAATTTTGEPGEPLPTHRISHAFGDLALPASEDNTDRCASWRLDNEAALYVQAVQLANEGSFHHSNWIVVPEDQYPGPDGYWNCSARGFEEVSAAQKGTVLFAQSTQSYSEEQRLAPGAVIKIPPRHKIVGLLHTLNLAPRDAKSGLWLSLDLLHPRDVTTVVTPMTLQYTALDIPGKQESRFTGVCDLATAHTLVSLKPLALRLHYILPHYHYLGNYFDVRVVGGELDGESVYTLSGFNGEGNGLTFDPPLALPGATGLRFTCGYDNWRDQSVKWGFGDGEMCVMLALVESDVVLGATVDSLNTLVAVEDDVYHYEGLCLAGGAAKHPNQRPPGASEREAPLYLPPQDPADVDLPPVPACRDIDPSVAPEQPATLGSIRATLFEPSCTFSACHGETAAAGLDLRTADLHALLIDHDALGSELPLVTPGDPGRSWLYQLLSRCEPTSAAGQVARHMPLNAPFLLDPALVNKVHAWIAAGAKDD